MSQTTTAIFSWRVTVKEKDSVWDHKPYYVVGPSKASACRQAKLMEDPLLEGPALKSMAGVVKCKRLERIL